VIVMSVRSLTNQYLGVNAHLHSLWQKSGGWDSFHNSHITHLTSALKGKLLPMGYTAESQQSLQIRRLGEPVGKPESDVTLYDAHFSERRRSSPPALQVQPAFPIPAMMSLEEEIAPYAAIGLYEFVPGQSDRGEPVAWIELLSPSNKPGGQDAAYYRNKRYKILRTGVVFVELDYLHESASTFDGIARYPANGESHQPEHTAHPYRIMVVDPRPALLEGLVYPAAFDVDTRIPTVKIPLNGDDVLDFDFNAPYQRTYEELFYGIELVDYSQLPANFSHYSPDDQTRILARMLAVLEAARDGIDLDENAPLPLKPLSLDEILAHLQDFDIVP